MVLSTEKHGSGWVERRNFHYIEISDFLCICPLSIKTSYMSFQNHFGRLFFTLYFLSF
jgi:hypothetical protein